MYGYLDIVEALLINVRRTRINCSRARERENDRFLRYSANARAIPGDNLVRVLFMGPRRAFY